MQQDYVFSVPVSKECPWRCERGRRESAVSEPNKPWADEVLSLPSYLLLPLPSAGALSVRGEHLDISVAHL